MQAFPPTSMMYGVLLSLQQVADYIAMHTCVRVCLFVHAYSTYVRYYYIPLLWGTTKTIVNKKYSCKQR